MREGSAVREVVMGEVTVGQAVQVGSSGRQISGEKGSSSRGGNNNKIVSRRSLVDGDSSWGITTY